MKTFTLVLTIIISLGAFQVSAKKIFSDIQTTDLQPQEKPIWQRIKPSKVSYPKELAMSKSAGCVVLSFDINEDGKTENIKVVEASSKRKISQYTKRMLKKWRWSLANAKATPTSESRLIRFDYCMSTESGQKAKAICAQQVKQSCESLTT